MDETDHALSWRVDVGRRIRGERERAGLTVDEIAARLKLRSSFVTAVEDGRGREQMDESYEVAHIRSIAQLLNMEVELPL